MTKDVQPDRSASTLASVSDEIYPTPLKSRPDLPAEDLSPAPAEDSDLSAAHTESFEGFSSFG
ncbi:hypothetical protein ASG60_02820 [Methylobacterium sp. Leaf469]|jgi:hypothetical protein|uniref:hypothetical protein n=1 Tax=unclassified Methylobacterium TaxID=2615210 RepID=UPI0006FD46A5|nr:MULTISPECIES: hypothetical protein [unclassified Methylobacterium]KQO66019.1 hypothetical protein ASF22_04950 [Methylobacterium sp. Leaf87]KQP28842.1 hypothetical protein ASF25_20345 [Methylobacterium sp. Leaf100]KQP34532.1 hypothetical protein ASF27_03045 [Methylobacterium sp. Leaf102]KQP72111.1 hypothetical protein ASF52_00820 [Methylobacterium sp. Leaf112]KQU05610.1 hypothetical protein ASG60_02820 [Methylobacterium sp. Leaf469]